MPNAPLIWPASLADGRKRGAVVSANIIVDFPFEKLEEVEHSWSPEREVSGGEHHKWDWRTKAESVKSGLHRIVAIECRGLVQGLMAILSLPRPARLEPRTDKVLYVDYLETAPWNLKRQSAPPQFLGVGTLLIATATRLSLDGGMEGRVGLHSLSQAEPFYRQRCMMTDLSADSDYYDLTDFEYTKEQASDLLKKIGIVP
jgi:hypothetical protein